MFVLVLPYLHTLLIHPTYYIMYLVIGPYAPKMNGPAPKKIYFTRKQHFLYVCHTYTSKTYNLWSGSLCKCVFAPSYNPQKESYTKHAGLFSWSETVTV